MTVEQEQSLKKKVLRGNWGIAKDKASIHASSALPPPPPRAAPAAVVLRSTHRRRACR
jgi:hypothetical protein